MNKIAVYLNRQISGNAFDKESILEAYSTDRSVLKFMPKIVAFPEKTEDVEKIIKFIDQLAEKDYKIPIGIWGSGLDATGADLTSGLLISTEKMNQIKEIDTHDRLIHIQSGVTLEQLNSALSTHGLCLPINANPKETIGGLIANCPTDTQAAFFGGIMNYIERIEVVLSDGSCIQTVPLKKASLVKKQSQDNLEGKVYREISKLIEENEDLMQKLFITQDLSGYPSVSRCSQDDGKTFDLLPIFYGSQGTLGLITEIILRVEPIPAVPYHIITSSNSLQSIFEILSVAKTLNPVELLLFDSEIFKSAFELGKEPSLIPKKILSNKYIVQATFIPNHFNKTKVKEFYDSLPKSTRVELNDPEEASSFHELSNPLYIYLNKSSKGEHSPIITDVHIPNVELPSLIESLTVLEKKYNVKLNLFGSFATNIYSIRPNIKIETEEGRLFIVEFLRDFNMLLKIHHGHLAGGSPEGRLKALLTNHDLTPEERKIYTSIKNIFDKNNVLSPDIKLNANPKTTSTHFRTKVNKTIQF